MTLLCITHILYAKFSAENTLMNKQNQLSRLKAAGVSPATLKNVSSLKKASHVAVMVDNVPVVLTGPALDEHSFSEALRLRDQQDFVSALRNAGHSGAITVRTIAGKDIDWKVPLHAIAVSNPGKVEMGGEESEVVWLFPQETHAGLPTFCCIHSEVESIATSFQRKKAS